MKALTRAYIVLLGFLIVGAVAAWYILWHNTNNNCGMATDCTEDYYRTWAMCLGVALGIAGGCMFALMAPKRQFLHAFLFAAATACIGFAILGFTRYIMTRQNDMTLFLIGLTSTTSSGLVISSSGSVTGLQKPFIIGSCSCL